MTDKNKGAELPLPGRVRYDGHGYLWDEEGHMFADTQSGDGSRARVRGFGHLTGTGAGGLNLSHAEACAYQDRVGERMAQAWNAYGEPIPMVLHCPKCGLQHVDAPEPDKGWDNPPHKSHLCHGCGCVWRPADVPTNGVESIETRGERDTWPTHEPVA